MKRIDLIKKVSGIWLPFTQKCDSGSMQATW